MENEQQVDFDIVFKPLLLACQSKQAPLTVIALDCMGKCFTHNFFQSMYKNVNKDSSLPMHEKLHEEHQTPLPFAESGIEDESHSEQVPDTPLSPIESLPLEI